MKININKINKIYMIGIKGVGMTMLAQYFKENGKEVSGSDVAEKFMTDEVLKKCDIKVFEKFSSQNIGNDLDLIIYSTAYNANNNEELSFALESKIPTIKYAEAMGEVFNQKYGIAVVGSHGKTTTTAWLGYVMEKAGKSPSVMVGARVPQFDGASLNGFSDFLVIEADEYQNKLQYFRPQAVLLNNIDYDHPDYFRTEDDYLQVFIDFIQKIPSKGFLVANFDDKNIAKIANVNCRGKVISYAINESADYVAYDIRQDQDKQIFNVKLGSDFETDELINSDLGEFSVSLSGKHNIYNALAVIAACVEFGMNLVDVRTYLEDFLGTARRMEIMGKFRGATIIDDYAHHPTEVKTTLAGIREKYKKVKIITVFHPHTFTRTRALLDDFAYSFDSTDELIVLDIYGSAREQQGGVSSLDLIKKIQERKNCAIKKISHIPNLEKVEEYLRENVERDDLIVLMGAGDVFRIGERLIGK